MKKFNLTNGTLERIFKEYSPLKPEEEKRAIEILLEYKLKENKTDEEEENYHKAFNQLILKNLRYVFKIAYGFYKTSNKNPTIEFNDLFSEGVMGLITSIERFDSSYNVRFVNYASWWIRNRILKYIAENSRNVRIPESVFYKNNGEGTVEISLEEDITTRHQRKLKFLEMLSSDHYISPDLKFLKEDIFRIINLLKIKEENKEIIKLYLQSRLDDSKLSLKEIGERYGITKERVSKIISEGIKKIRQYY
ncbi:MAG: sigma-70 family RNA polymerase sigma factor [Candidatus Pacearchaeota archaeon]